MEEFAWACQFVTTRCFGWNLPSTILCPMIDLINHYAREQCTTEIAHLGLERERDTDKRKLMKYKKVRGHYDMKLLVPESSFDPGDRKSNSVHLVESFTRKVYRYHS